MGKSHCSLLVRKVAFFILAFLILGAGLATQYGLLKWQQAIIDAENIYSVQVGFAVFKALFVAIFNFVLERVIIKTT